MQEQRYSVHSDHIPIEVKKKNLIVKGEHTLPGNTVFFDISYPFQVKNLMITSTIQGKVAGGNKEIRFYFRFKDEQNHCCFTIRCGNEVQYKVISEGNPSLQTAWYSITKGDLFTDKFDLIVSIFEESTTVLIDNVVILHVEQTPEVEGEAGIQFACPKGDQFDMKFENLNFTEEVLNFEPIIEMPKSSDVYFMHANDFYEQDRYDLAMIYYRKGLIFGPGDDKIYNRVGNLLFLFEEYDRAVSFYRQASEISPDKPEYQINLARGLARLGKIDEALPMFDEMLANGISDTELFVDYAECCIRRREFDKAVGLLNRARERSADNPAILSKLGKCMIELDNVSEGKQHLLEAARLYAESDPSSAAIILKYSLEKGADSDSLELLCVLLSNQGDHQSIFELIKQSQWEVELNDAIMEYLVTAEIELNMFDRVLKEFEYFRDKQISPHIKLLKARALIACGDYDSGMHDLSELKKDLHLIDVSANDIAALELSAMGGTGNTDTIDDVYTQAKSDEDGYSRVKVEYGKILVDLGRYEEAVTILTSILPEYNNNVEVLYNLGLACHSLDDFLVGRDYLLKAQSLAPGTPVIIFALASTLYYTKEYVEALQLARIVYDELPKDGKTDNLLGNIFLGLNMISEAQKSYYLALELDPDNQEFALNLAESFYQLKDYENALMITRQLVSENMIDRARSLHLRLKSHLYEVLKCDGCGVEWEFPKAREDATIEISRLEELPDNAPAGVCSNCKKVFCRTCAPGKPGVDAVCPKCKSTLTYEMPGVRIIADRLIRGEDD